MGGDEQGDVGDTTNTEDALTSGGCDRNKLLAGAGGARKTAIQRGLAWFDQHVPYSQSRSHEGYRTDCSGFVSMCWQLGQSYTTADFSSGGGQSHSLSSYTQLQPGDAVVRRVGGEGHILMFAGWADSAHTTMCALEERSTQLGLQFHTRDASSLKSMGYKPIRANKFPNSAGSGGGASPPPPPPPPDPGTDDPGTDDPGNTDPGGTDPGNGGGGGGGGQSCSNDGDCNPGNDGAGLMCSGGQCVPGCHASWMCPGSTRCVSGQCR